MEIRDLLLIGTSSLLLFAAAFLASRWFPALWDEVALRTVARFSAQMRSIGLDTSRLPVLLRWWGLSVAVTFGVSAFVLRIPVIGVALVCLLFVAPSYYLEHLIARRRSLLRDQMVGASVALANTTRAGLSLAQGLETVSKETPQPLAAEFRRVVQDYERGRTLPDSLRDAKERLALDSFTLFATALLTCLDRGGRVTEALERISKSLQENQRLERKLEADTASGRKIVVILAIFPLVFLLGFYAMDPESTGVLFSTLAGQCVVVVVLGLMYLSARWAKKILSIEL
jgi:tight adherence protein B